MDNKTLTIDLVKQINKDTYYMKLRGDCREIRAPGQFINISLPGRFLRRPISIFEYTDDSVSVLFKVVGRGTADMADMTPGTDLEVLLPLGNGFDVNLAGNTPLLVAGGIGMPPIYGVARELCARGISPQIICGFNTENDVLPLECFTELGLRPTVTTIDGSVGKKGLVTDVMREMTFDYVFACGPKAMLRAVYEQSPSGQFSFEERMGCGFGACMGCTCRTKNGFKRICTDGPVLSREEIIWD